MIFAFGNPVYDYIKTPTITTGERVLSGCSTNGCLALARLGHRTTLVGRIGADYAERFQADMARYQIAEQAELCEQTGGFGLIYDAMGNRTLDVLGVAAPIENVPPTVAAAQAVIIGPILQETSFELIERVRSGAAWQPPMFGIPTRPPDWDNDIPARLQRHNLAQFLDPSASWPATAWSSRAWWRPAPASWPWPRTPPRAPAAPRAPSWPT